MNLNLLGYITTSTSYGLVTLNLMKSLMDLGVNVATHGISHNEDYGSYNTYVRKSALSSKLFDAEAPCLSVRHQFDMAQSIGCGTRIGYTFFEVNKLTPLETNHLRSLDKLIVPSMWAADICIRAGIHNTEVCPAGYDETIFKPVKYMPPSCVFLSVGKWEVRKQQDAIVMAFNKAFGPKDNVKLWMSCNNKFIKDYVDQKKIKYKEYLGDKLTIIDYIKEHSDLARLMQQSYCFVAPSLAEGWNLPLLEAMACGKFNIATNYSAHTQFCNDESSILIEPTGLVDARDDMWFKEGNETNNGQWCSYSEDDLISSMQLIYKKYKDGIVLNEDAAENAKRFTWTKSAEKMRSIIQDSQISLITQRDQNMGLYDVKH